MESTEIRTPAEPPTELSAEGRYRTARARLRAAQQEKMEATDEFLAARAAMRGGLGKSQLMDIRGQEYGPSGTPAAWA